MPALGKDLSTIRSHLGLSIQDVQHATKIPVSTLKSIENGTIFDHPEENQTYLRSFVRSYGRALKIDDDIMIKALDQREAGNYTHLLLREYPELNPNKPAEPAPEQFEEEKPSDFVEEDHKKPEVEEQDSHIPTHEPEQYESSEEDVEEPDQKTEITQKEEPRDEIKPKQTATSPSVKSVDWADVGRKFSNERKHTPIWIVILIIILILAAVLGYFLYEYGYLDFSNDASTNQEQVEPENQTSQNNLSLDLDDSMAVSETENPEYPSQQVAQLDEILQITVYAAFDGLGPVRVWSDIKPRMDPYWLEEGMAMEFEFEDTIRVRGTYTDMLLFKDGNLIENAAQEFLNQEDNYLQITRNYFEGDGKWASAVDYELPEGVQPPDSIITRPSF